MQAWFSEYPAINLKSPIVLTIGQDEWPDIGLDAVFTANTTHIMQVSEAKLMMQTLAENLPSGGVFCQYGPFNIDGQYTSESNRQFDQHLKHEGCGGIQDIAQLQAWAEGLQLQKQVVMPANNLLLVWKKA